MEDLVLMEPLGLENLVMSHLIWIVVAQERQHIVGLGIWVSKAVLVLPFILVHAKDEVLRVDVLLFLQVVEPLDLLLIQKVVVGIWHPLVVLEKTSTREFLDSWWILLSKINVLLLLISCILQYLIGPNMIWQFSQSIVVSSTEAPLDQVSLLIGIIIEHWEKSH